MRSPSYNLYLLLALLWCSSIQGVTIGWDSVEGAAGYKVYWGLVSRIGLSVNSYDLSLTTGTNLSATIPSPIGQQQHIAVTAYNDLGIESGFSEEIVYTRPQAVEVLFSLALEKNDMVDNKDGWVVVTNLDVKFNQFVFTNLFVRGVVTTRYLTNAP